MVNIISSTKLDQNVDQWGYNVIKRSTDVSLRIIKYLHCNEAATEDHILIVTTKMKDKYFYNNLIIIQVLFNTYSVANIVI